MKKALTVIVIALIAPAGAGAQVYKGPLPALPQEQTVRIDEVTLPPGASVPAHRHDAHVYVYMIEGMVEMQVEGGEVVRLRAGEVFTEGLEDIHTVMRNPSASEPARFVSFTIHDAGATGFTLIGQDSP